MSYRWSRAGAIAQKEMYHVLRDRFTLLLSIALPVFMVFAFGYAIEFNVKNIPLSVHDADKTQASRRVIDTFASSGYFIIDTSTSPVAAQEAITADRARAALIIPAGFQRDLLAGGPAQAQVLLDGSDNSTVGPILGYVASIEAIASRRLANFDPPNPIEIRTRFLFNPELNSRWFVIPGLAVTVLAILAVLLTALTVAREWEDGSMELLLSTPAEPLEIIVGKLAPYGVLGLIAVAFVDIIARTVFGLPFAGSHTVFWLGTMLFLATYLAQGLLISVITRRQQIAMQIAMISGMIPSTLLSGFIFPIESMPTFFHYFTMILPARWFMVVARESYLKGSTLAEMGIAFLALGMLCLLIVMLATRRFKRDLEP